MFIEKYEIEKTKPAVYNPRKIDEKSFLKLQESIKKFGVLKPVIINKNGILVAGHQRTKAMKAIGITHTPAFILEEKVNVQDEIKFNLIHNSIETETSVTKILGAENLKFGFNTVKSEKIKIIKKSNGSLSKEILRLLNKYGSYGSVVINEEGDVIHNSDYAFSCSVLQKEILVYKLENKKMKDFLSYFNHQYGVYTYEFLNIKPYVQTHCQMNRNETYSSSSTYEKLVIPNITKKMKGIDFGAGRCFYPTKLNKLGYNFKYYEPFFKKTGSFKLDITSVVNMIKKIEKQIADEGLFDFVVLDSVLNSVSSDEYENAILTACNALMKDEGTFFVGTRNLKAIIRRQNQKTDTWKGRNLEFLDSKNYSGTFRRGVWTLQKFHTLETLKELLEKYFKEVEVFGGSGSQIWAKCKKPIRFSKEEYEKALELEFNIEYPQNFRHNEHNGLIGVILKNLF